MVFLSLQQERSGHGLALAQQFGELWRVIVGVSLPSVAVKSERLRGHDESMIPWNVRNSRRQRIGFDPPSLTSQLFNQVCEGIRHDWLGAIVKEPTGESERFLHRRRVSPNSRGAGPAPVQASGCSMKARSGTEPAITPAWSNDGANGTTPSRLI